MSKIIKKDLHIYVTSDVYFDNRKGCTHHFERDRSAVYDDNIKSNIGCIAHDKFVSCVILVRPHEDGKKKN